jgi:transposase
MGRFAQLLGIDTPETVRRWCRQDEVDAGHRLGVSIEDSVELRRLKRENAELERANAILKAASSAFFAAELIW